MKSLHESIRELRAAGATELEASAIGAYTGDPAERIALFRVDNRKKWRAGLVERGVPERYLKSVFDTIPKDTEVIKLTKSWLLGAKTFLFLSGGLGTGKSAAAAWACTKKMGTFVTAYDLQNSFGFDQDAQSARRRYREAELLVVDDLGTEMNDSKDWFTGNFSALMDYRYSAMKRTIVTGNILPDAFKERYPRLADRIREDGDFYLVPGTSTRAGS